MIPSLDTQRTLSFRTLRFMAAAFAAVGLTLLGTACGSTGQRSEVRAGTEETGRGAEAQEARDLSGSAAPADSEVVRSSLAVPTGDERTSVLLLEMSAPAEIPVGQPFAYQVIVSNLTAKTVQDVVVTDVFPAHYEYSHSIPDGEVEGRSVRWRLDYLGPREKQAIWVHGVAMETGPIACGTSVSYQQSLFLASNAVDPRLRVRIRAPEQSLLCDDIQVALDVTNTGRSPVRGVQLDVLLPQELTAADGEAQVHLDVGSLQAGYSREIPLLLRAKKPGDFSVQALATTEDDLMSRSPTATVHVRRPDVRIDKKGPAQAKLGERIQYEISVANVGMGEARDVVVEDGMHSGLAFLGATANGEAVGGKVVWRLGTLLPRDMRQLVVYYEVAQTGVVTTEAVVNGNCVETSRKGIRTVLVDPKPAPQVAQADPEVEQGRRSSRPARDAAEASAGEDRTSPETEPVAEPPAPDPVPVPRDVRFRLKLSGGAKALVAGREVTYEIEVSNEGMHAAPIAVLSFRSPDQLVFVSADGPVEPEPGQGPQSYNIRLTDFAPGTSSTWKLTFKGGAAGKGILRVAVLSEDIETPLLEKSEVVVTP